jgi:hypothetical protein
MTDRWRHVHRACAVMVLVACAACTGRRPARLSAGNSGTVIVNSRRPVQLPVRVVDAAGRVLGSRGLRYEWVSGDHVPLSDGGRVTCERPADSRVRVTRGDLTMQLVLRCQPIAGFRLPRGIHLQVGGPPQELEVNAVDAGGRPVMLVAGTASVRDSQVAVLDHGLVYPGAAGFTYVKVEVGDCVSWIPVDVIAQEATPAELRPFQEFASSLRLVGGEMRSWHIAQGRYELSLVPDPSAHTELVLGAVGANCARFPDGGQHYSCIAREGAAVVVRHPRGAGQGRELGGNLSVRRLQDLADARVTTQLSARDPDRDGPGRATPDECPIFLR